MEVRDTISPLEDREIQFSAEILTRQGIKVCTNNSVKTFTKNKGSTQVQLSSGESKEFDRIIVVVGIQANTENIGVRKYKS